MSATNETTYYKLPQFTDTDQPTWLGDFNGAMGKIDSALNAVGANASTALSAANNAVNRVGQVETTIAGVQTTANNAYSLSSTHEKHISALEGQVAQLETKFPITSDSLSNGAVTAAKLDQTAIAAMWAGLTVKQFNSEDSSAANEGMVVPSGGKMAGFYIVELGILVMNKMSNKYITESSALFTLPSYVPNSAASGIQADGCIFVWNEGSSFVNWTSLTTIKSTRQLRVGTYPNVGNSFTLMGSVALYMGVNTGVQLSNPAAYQTMNPTVG
jgi:hypothetical protein|uniref:Uncharacterized protein n=1 Tax=Podoviridae sp. ctnuR9 TaxID=2825276 RepID=A0A8S5UFT7_9CAUD|nr:MAG TPA: hypothetical protein [Podoviridae sp. ctnuR9]